MSLLVLIYLYQADLMQVILKLNEKRIVQSFNVKFRYIDDVRSRGNSQFGYYSDHTYIQPGSLLHTLIRI